MIINLLTDYVEEEQNNLKKFLKKYEKPIVMTLKKYAIIGSAKDFDEAKDKSEIISVTNLHRFCSDMQIEPLFLKKEEVDVCIQKYIEMRDKASSGYVRGYKELKILKAFNKDQLKELLIILAVNMFRKPPIDLSNHNPYVSFVELMKHFANLEMSKDGYWIIWDNPIYAGVTLSKASIDFV